MRIAPPSGRLSPVRVTPARVASFVLVAGVVSLACGGSKPLPPKPPPPQVSETCPDSSNTDELAAFDYAKEYVLSPEAADQLKAAVLAAAEIGALSERLDADLGMACARAAHDLGEEGDWRSGTEACTAAVKAVQEARAKLGPKLETRLVVSPPMCLVDEALATKCASMCDSSVPAGKILAACEEKAGRCDGDCDGSCEPNGAIKCEGTCAGACEGAMEGTCGGRCVGRCDGKRSNGPCLGTCVGTCNEGTMVGECKGSCTGTCQLAKPGICEGLCAGTCSVDLTDPRCAGAFKAPEVSSECRARCDLAVLNATECSVPQVGLAVAGVKERDAEALRSALGKSLPGLLQILYALGENGGKRLLDAQAVIENARAGFETMARSGAAPAASRAQLVRCFDERFERAAAQATATKKAIDEAIAIRDAAAGGKMVSLPSAPTE